MPGAALRDVCTAEELARAAGVPRAVIASVVASGELQPVRGSGFFAFADAARVASRLREIAAVLPTAADRRVLGDPRTAASEPSRARVSFAGASIAHAVILALALMLGLRTPSSAPAPAPEESARLVFLVTPGPGGGGGGSGARRSRPASRLERRGVERAVVSVPRTAPAPVLASLDEPATPVIPSAAVPEPVAEPPEPLASAPIVAPVVVRAVDRREQQGTVDAPTPAPAQGPGTGGAAGAGRGDGSGAGTGAGIGPGSGGGTGGGPYRPGSGITPPRLLREVKADYTEAARRAGVSGEVVLEIVVRSDGRVGDVTVLRGLAAGLNEEAIAAVRQWQFAPATRSGAPVDVIVEVAVEFTLR